VGVLYTVGLVVGYVLLVPLMLLAQIPIDSVQNFLLLKVLQPVLTAGAGEFRVLDGTAALAVAGGSSMARPSRE